jgi:2-polyprenyl-3-methyl-5-hydroxy-6-metoxy-1,4-benzoquinol methylase
MENALDNRDPCVTYYDANAAEYCAATLNIDMNAIRSRFLSNVPAGARILDAGCGSGRDTVAFLRDGYSVKAFDGSAKMAECASIYSGQTCEVLRFQDMAFDREFDAVWSCAALLHVPKAEMRDVLERIIHSLKLGGVAYFSFIEGNDERVSSDGRFYNSYTMESLREVLQSVGGTRELDSWRSVRDPDAPRPAPWLNIIIERTTL